MQDTVVKLTLSGGFMLAAVVWVVQHRRTASQLRDALSMHSARAYTIAAIAAAASWVLIPVSIWAPNQQVWSTAGGLCISISMLVQFRAEGRKRLAEISLWTTALSGICLLVFVLLMVFAHDAGTASIGSVGRGSSARVIVGLHDHSPSPIPDSGASPRQ